LPYKKIFGEKTRAERGEENFDLKKDRTQKTLRRWTPRVKGKGSDERRDRKGGGTGRKGGREKVDGGSRGEECEGKGDQELKVKGKRCGKWTKGRNKDQLGKGGSEKGRLGKGGKTKQNLKKGQRRRQETY
jgi:hypothetical protein